MKRMWLLLVLCGLAGGYVPNSFRHASTAGILWDDYDWLLYNPASIPEIEGGRLYTNLSNLVTHDERQFVPEGLGYFLFGLKTGPIGLIGDHKELKIADSTGIDGILGRAEVVDTSYSVDPETGELRRMKVTRGMREAWSKEQNRNLMAGIGIPLGENLNIGFSYAHSRTLLEVISPDENYFSFETEVILDTVQKVDSALSTGIIEGYADYDRFRLGFLRTGDLLDLHLGLGFDLFSLNPYRSELEEFRWETKFRPDTTRSITGLDSEATFPLSGLSLPIEVLGIGRLGETGEILLGLGGEFGKGSWNDARMYLMGWDSTITQVVNVSLDSLSTEIAGEHSGYRAHLFTKGLFSPDENLRFGLGLRLDFSSTTDWMSFHHFGQGRSISPEMRSSVDSTYQDSLHLRATGWTISVPVGVEFRPISPISFRLGGLFEHAIADTTRDSLGVGVKQVRRIVEREGAPPDTTIEYRDYSIPHYTNIIKEVDNRTLYTFGLGYKVTENLQIDLMGFSKLLDLTDWRVSVILKF